jgi:RNA polymerase sigma-70 factor, ECF subfamily
MIESIINYPSGLNGFTAGRLCHATIPLRRICRRTWAVSVGCLQTEHAIRPTRGIMDWTIEESRIVEAVLHGDVEDFRILVERYQRPIYSLMLRITRTPMTAEDLTQDAFERAYAKLHTFKSGKRFFPWLYTIAVNAGRDHLRRKGIQNDIFSTASESIDRADDTTDNCVKHLDCMMDAGRVSEAVDHLPLKYSEPLLLYYKEGFSVKEIAAALSISVPSVKVRIHRGRGLLKTAIGVKP